ncbi:MAG: HEAT repeat domain-containing protein, partial [Planctomycetota bacterium]
PDKARKGGGLDLPSGAPVKAATPAPAPADPASPAAPAQVGNDASAPAARSIFEDVARLRKPTHAQLESAADALLQLGTAARTEALRRLAGNDESALIVATRVLLSTGVAEDSQAVVQRLTQPLPPRASATLISQVIELNPVAASPRWLIGILGHKQKPARLAAFRQLQTLAERPNMRTEDWLPDLAEVLETGTAHAREMALTLVGQMPLEATLQVVLGRLGDSSGQVAHLAVEILSRSNMEAVEAELLVRAFGSQWILRENAYALLALIEREDRTQKPVLHNGHVETLLKALEMNEPMVHGTAALALAGIAFRSEGQTPAWLHPQVMDELVAVAAAITYFEDRQSLIDPTLRRLQQLTGNSFGNNGPAWAEWWIGVRSSFRPSRVAMAYTEAEVPGLMLEYADRRSGEHVVLVGPERMYAEGDVPGAVPYFLTAAECQEVVTWLQQSGALGSGQMPGPRGSMPDLGQQLEVMLGTSAKSFSMGPEHLETWFEQLASSIEALVDANRWQDYSLTSEFKDKREWAWHVQTNEPRYADESLRTAWLAGVYRDWLMKQPVGYRRTGLRALQALAAESGGVLPAEIFDSLIHQVGEYRTLGNEASVLFEVAHAATGLAAGPKAGPEAAGLGERLIGTLIENYGFAALEPIGKVLADLGPERIRLAAGSSDGVLRAAAGVLWVNANDPALADGIETLLKDKEAAVVVPVLTAAGLQHRADALSFALLYSSDTRPELRTAALRTLGRLGGDRARETLMLVLGEPSDTYRRTAAEGLADLKDVKAGPILVALLRNARAQGILDVVRRGLLDLGPAAHESLLAALTSPSVSSRREAALLLGLQDVPRAAPALMRILTEDSTDSEVAGVLVGLTCVDLTRQEDRAEAWWAWWDSVRQQDALSWFLAACAHRGLPYPHPIEEHFLRPQDLGPDGSWVGSRLSKDGMAFLLEAMRREEPWLAARAWREWNRRSDVVLEPMPENLAVRRQWVNQQAEALAQGRQ